MRQQAALHKTDAAIAAWVKSARLKVEMTGEELGAQLDRVLGHQRGHTKANISHWETGKHSPNIRQLIAIREITGIELPEEAFPRSDSENSRRDYFAGLAMQAHIARYTGADDEDLPSEDEIAESSFLQADAMLRMCKS